MFRDYLQFGMIGLLESIDRFDPTAGNKFESYASHRIRGAILTGVESLSEKQRQISDRQRARSDRAKSLRVDPESGRPIDEPLDPLERLADVAVGLAIGVLPENPSIYVDEERATESTPYDQVELKQLRRELVALVNRLPSQERLVIHRHYYQHVPFEQIAETLQLTKGRISQIHHGALRRLKDLHCQSRELSAKG